MNKSREELTADYIAACASHDAGRDVAIIEAIYGATRNSCNAIIKAIFYENKDSNNERDK